MTHTNPRRRGRIARALTVVALVLGISAFAGCAPAYSRVSEPVLIAGGNSAGVYSRYATLLAESMTRDLPITVQAVATQGSVDNLRRVARGDAVLGFAQGDTAADAIAGSGAFERPLEVRAVARVYDEYVHIVVPDGSEVKRISDLAGRTVSLGSADSGVQVIAGRILAASGLKVSDVENRALGAAASIEALRGGEIEAFFWVGALATPGIEKLAEQMPIRLVSIDASTIEHVNDAHLGVYRSADFPAGAYGIDHHTTTMTVPNYLVTSPDASDELIRDSLDVLFRSREWIAREVRAAEFLDPLRAIFTSPVELHPGAVDYFTSQRR